MSQCGEVIRDRARGPLSDGRATLNRIEHENGDWFELTPANERACPVSVTPNGPGDGELAIGLGRNDAWFEAWGSPDETINVLQKTIDAAIAGENEEFHKGKRHIGRRRFPMVRSASQAIPSRGSRQGSAIGRGRPTTPTNTA